MASSVDIILQLLADDQQAERGCDPPRQNLLLLLAEASDNLIMGYYKSLERFEMLCYAFQSIIVRLNVQD
jgi:hypothetical protein